MFDARSRRSLQEKFERSANPERVTMLAEGILLILGALTFKEQDPQPVEAEGEVTPQPAPEPEPEPQPEPVPEPEPQPEPETDLVKISDIGPEEAKKLVAVGVGSLKALAKWTEPARMAWNETVTPENIQRWRDEAQRILAQAK